MSPTYIRHKLEVSINAKIWANLFHTSAQIRNIARLIFAPDIGGEKQKVDEHS